MPWTNQAQLSWSLEKLARRLINSLVGIYLPHCLTDRVKIVISGFEVAYWRLWFQKQSSSTTIVRARTIPRNWVDGCSLWSDGLWNCSNRSSHDGFLETLHSLNFSRGMYNFVLIYKVNMYRCVARLGSLRRLKMKKNKGRQWFTECICGPKGIGWLSSSPVGSGVVVGRKPVQLESSDVSSNLCNYVYACE